MIHPYLLLTQLQRQSLLLESMTLFPTFAADLANQESMEIRDEIIATEIMEHASDADVVVMLVGALHLEGGRIILKKMTLMSYVARLGI